MAFERIEPGTVEWEAYYANHIQRYQFAAAELLRRPAENVLDAACGVGYGSHYLANQGVPRITAVDQDRHALEIASQQFAHPAITFIEDDCHSLVSDASRGPFDAIVSFETLEHLIKPKEFLSRCRAILSPQGILLISTPNRLVSSPDSNIKWHFHEQEYTASEFSALLTEAGFSKIALFAQRMTVLGRLRSEMRAEINSLRFNPFYRVGSWLQRVLRAVPTPPTPLPERVEDFEIVPTDSEECDRLGAAGPFVLVATAFA